MNIMLYGESGIYVPHELEAGGKPSTWFPPGTLVELIQLKEFRH